MPVSEETFDVCKDATVGLVIIGRTAGEDRDNAPEKGSWFLTDEEEALLDIVSKYFENTVAVIGDSI